MAEHILHIYNFIPVNVGLPRWCSGKRIHLPMQRMPEIWIQPLGQEDPLEKEMATHSSILAWEIPWTEEPGGLQSMGSKRVGHDLSIPLTVSNDKIWGWGGGRSKKAKPNH